MAGKHTRKPQFAIVIGRPGIDPEMALAQVIVATAATYVMEHFEEFEAWLEKMHLEHNKEMEAPITKEVLTESIGRVILSLPDAI